MALRALTPPADLRTLKEASAIMRTPVSTLREWISTGRLPAFRPGRLVLVREADLAALLERSRIGAH